ncbi:ATP-binding protein [Planomonospora sp. ID82291]|uniref:ATP-binding protein n=1 Tax=Planomonospora sp. ID82291 TaxID=2738136 RepID=UPI0018C389C6|nr:ATP-binding protein [Planomonospora sp. ID82291]MBG0816629.1 CHASE domain-containing protein [Planomonospora sp. ID82291]
MTTFPRRMRAVLRESVPGPALAVLCAGVAASLVLGTMTGTAQRRSAEAAIDRRATSTQAVAAAELQRYVDALRMTADALATGPEPTQARFEAVTRPLGYMRLRGATSVMFVAPVASARVAEAQRLWRARGATGLELIPAAGRQEQLFVTLRRTLGDSSPPPLGVNAALAAEPAEALRRARATGSPAVSAPYVLLSDRALPKALQQSSFVVAAPVTGTVAGQQDRMLGWAVIGVHGTDFLSSTVSWARQGRLRLTLDADGTEVVRLGEDHDDMLYRRVSVPVADRRWWLTVGTDRATLNGGAHLSTVITGAGLLLTLLLAVLVSVLAGSRARARAQVAAATAELRRTEAEARHQAALLTTIMDNISDGVGVVDADGCFLLNNPAATSILGVSEDRDGAETWPAHYGIRTLDGDPFPAEQLPLARALAGHASEERSMVIRNPAHPEGIVVSVSARPLDLPRGRRGAVAVFHDITERRRAAQAIEDLNTDLRRLNAELEQRVAERTAQLQAQSEALRQANAELEAFSYSVSHDLRAPLRSVDGFAKMLMLDHADRLDGSGRRYLDKIRDGAQRMGQLIDGLLAFSRLQRQAMSFRPVAMGDVVAEAWRDLAAERAGRDITLTVSDLPTAHADPGLMRHVIMNLLGNAVKYTRGRERAEIEVGSHRDASGHVVYAVRDNGTGFDMRYADKLFQVFQRLHRAEDYEGTGIGLALAARVVHRHGGRIWAEAAPDAGAAFFFRLHPDGDDPSTTEEPAHDTAA